MNKIEHIGIAVNDIDSAIIAYEAILGVSCNKTEVVDSEGVKTAFFNVGESKVELLGATNENSPIFKFLEKKGQGIHHIAFQVSDISQEINRLITLGFELINPLPKDGADNKIIAFLHPKSTEGVLIELCQDKN